MLTLPGEYWGLVRELTPQVRDAEAGLLTADLDDDPDVLWAALDEACRRAGKRVRRAWVGHDHAALAWLHEDDVRLQLAPWLTVVGVRAPVA
jgi:hypothetical protein